LRVRRAHCAWPGPCAWRRHQKLLPPTGEVDDGVILKVDMTKMPATVRTATVTLKVK
jgi:hypothetical protein